MWKTFQNKGELYMIKIAEGEILEIHLTDLKEIWVQNISKESLLNQFQEINPLFDVKCDEAVSEVVGLVNRISDIVDLEIIKSEEILQLILRSTKSNFNIQFIFNFDKASLEVFLKEVTVPLIQTVKHMEDQQKMLCNIIQKKDREIEEYKLEKGTISRDDLITEKFDESIVNNIDDKSMLNVFGSSQVFWDTFVHHHGNIKATVENIEKDPWNHIKRKRKIYSSMTGIKKGKAHIKEVAENVIDNSLPQTSSSRYWKEYELFMNWCKTNVVNNYNESVLLAYFEYKSKKLKSSTLWSIFSMLKSTLNIKHNINIEKYTKLIAFLKRTKDGYVPKKSKILEIEQVENFINNAPDEHYLMIKTALIIGMCAACRRHELTNLKIEDIQDRGDVLIINIADTKTQKCRSSCITEPLWIGIVRKYMSLRPLATPNTRFFLYYAKNRCTKQPVGIHTFGSMPSKIASFLQLENPKEYTAHCFRRSSAAVLAGHGADITTLKRHGGWKSTSVAEGYIEDSFKSENSNCNQLTILGL